MPAFGNVAAFGPHQSPVAGVVRSRRPGQKLRKASVPRISPEAVSIAAALIDLVLVFSAAYLARVFYGDTTSLGLTLLAGGITAGLYLLIGLARHDYSVSTMLNGPGTIERVVTTWLLAFGLALTLAFLTKTTASYSRGANVLFFVGGLAGVPLGRVLLVHYARRWAVAGRLVLRRIMLVGGAPEIDAFMRRYDPSLCGLRLVSAAVLRDDPGTLSDDLALAVAAARMHQPNDLFLLLPWSDEALIARSVDALQRLPAAVHLGPTALLERYVHLRLERAGPIASVRLVRPPLSPIDLCLKRAFDIGAAMAALVLLAPLFMLIAVAIKLDSRGPIFFLQRRTGFNQQPFRIVKFRSMLTMEDTAALRQVTAGDARVTSFGRFLRRTSLDELPQLLNVLRGEMSLIGPRPHALAHDQAFGRTHDLYERRHNMRPGITGWAQVSGFRGETDTPDKIEGRVRHDLDYVDNWSIWLDLRILLRTVFSPQTFRNAK